MWAGAVPITGTYGAIAGIGGCLGQLYLQMLLWDNIGHNTCGSAGSKQAACGLFQLEDNLGFLQIISLWVT